MKKENVLEKVYEENINLNVLYEILDKFYNSININYFPNDVVKKMESLINALNKYTYHSKDGYDIISESYYSKITYRKQ